MPGHDSPPFASDAWMLMQQTRAEMEADGWRKLRAQLATPLPEPAQAEDPTRGSAVLKALVRFALGAFGGWMGWIGAMDSQLGEFEVWLSVLSGFVIMLALSAVGVGKQFVQLLSEVMRWALIVAFLIGVFWIANRVMGV